MAKNKTGVDDDDLSTWSLQSMPVDILLTVGTFLRRVDHSNSLSHYPPDIDEITFAGILNDHDMLEHYVERYDKKDMTISVAQSNNLWALKWVIKEKKCPMIPYLCSYVVTRQNFNMLRWLHKQGCPWDEETGEVAAYSGDLNVLKYLKEHGCPWNERACMAAASGGHLNVLKYLKEHGCPWDERACIIAARNGDLNVLKYLTEHGCPWDKDTSRAAAYSGDLNVLKYLKEHRCPWNERACMSAARNGHLHLLKYLRQHGCPWDTLTCFYAAYFGHADVLRWAIENGCPEPMNVDTYIQRKRRIGM